MTDTDEVRFFSIEFGADVLSDLGALTPDQLSRLAHEIDDEVAAIELALTGNTDRETIAYLISRRRYAKYSERRVDDWLERLGR
jgi:hypothetical protein